MHSGGGASRPRHSSSMGDSRIDRKRRVPKEAYEDGDMVRSKLVVRCALILKLYRFGRHEGITMLQSGWNCPSERSGEKALKTQK